MPRHPPRALLALTAFLALQGLPAGSAAACSLTGHYAAASGGEGSRSAAAIAFVMGDMPGMSSKSVPSATVGGPTIDVDPATDQIKAPARGDGAPCGHDTAPPACTAMPLCGVFVKSSSVHLDRTAVPVARAATIASRAPAFVAFPPELPPPRA